VTSSTRFPPAFLPCLQCHSIAEALRRHKRTGAAPLAQRRSNRGAFPMRYVTPASHTSSATRGRESCATWRMRSQMRRSATRHRRPKRVALIEQHRLRSTMRSTRSRVISRGGRTMSSRWLSASTLGRQHAHFPSPPAPRPTPHISHRMDRKMRLSMRSREGRRPKSAAPPLPKRCGPGALAISDRGHDA